MYNIPGNKANIEKSKRIEIIQNISPDNRIKLEISNIKIAGKSQNVWGLKSTVLSSTRVIERKSQEKLKVFWNKN